MDSDLSDSFNMNKLLLGPGPSNVPKRVLTALSNNCISHLDPDFFSILDEISENLKSLFKTENETTFAISGTGSAGMEAAFANLIDEGDKVLVFSCGLFGERMAEVAERYGANVVIKSKEWGEVFQYNEIINSIKEYDDLKIVSIVHAETSTGAHQPISDIGNFLKNRDIIFLVDSVTSFTGTELNIDDWGIDVCYSGTQKCLNVPPGLSPITFSEKALRKIRNRKQKVKSWYLDLNLLKNYLGEKRVYHHTAPVNMLYGLNEGLKICLEEGLEKRILRHKDTSEYFNRMLHETGLKLFVKDNVFSLPMLKSIQLDKKISDGIRIDILKKHKIEIGGGLGHTKGLIWRVGFMGCNSNKESVDVFFETLKNYV